MEHSEANVLVTCSFHGCCLFNNRSGFAPEKYIKSPAVFSPCVCLCRFRGSVCSDVASSENYKVCVLGRQVENWCPRLPWRTKILSEETDRRGQVRNEPLLPNVDIHCHTVPDLMHQSEYRPNLLDPFYLCGQEPIENDWKIFYRPLGR